MPEPGYADDGFFLRRVDAPDVKGIEVCGIEELSDGEPVDCKLFREGTPEFAVAEKLLDLLEASDRAPATLVDETPTPAEPVWPLRPTGTLAIEI